MLAVVFLETAVALVADLRLSTAVSAELELQAVMAKEASDVAVELVAGIIFALVAVAVIAAAAAAARTVKLMLLQVEVVVLSIAEPTQQILQVFNWETVK